MNAIAPSQISFRQILIATDLSDASSNALHYAKAIAKRYASHLVLVHVCHPVAHIPRPASLFDQPLQHPRHASAAQAGVGFKRQTLARVRIHHAEDAHHPSAGGE